MSQLFQYFYYYQCLCYSSLTAMSRLRLIVHLVCHRSSVMTFAALTSSSPHVEAVVKLKRIMIVDFFIVIIITVVKKTMSVVLVQMYVNVDMMLEALQYRKAEEMMMMYQMQQNDQYFVYMKSSTKRKNCLMHILFHYHELQIMYLTLCLTYEQSCRTQCYCSSIATHDAFDSSLSREKQNVNCTQTQKPLYKNANRSLKFLLHYSVYALQIKLISFNNTM